MTLLAPPPAHHTSDAHPAVGSALDEGRHAPAAPPEPGASRFRKMTADLSTARKLGLLTVVCLLPSVVLLGVSVTSTSAAADDARTYEQVQLASAELFHLDNRNSEIKADAFRSLIPNGDTEAAVSDTADDVASAQDVITTLQGLDVPAAMEKALSDLGPVAGKYYDAVDAFVADATDGQGPAPSEQVVIDANHELDSALEDLRTVVT